MTSSTKKRPGRPKIVNAPSSITITLDEADVALAEQLAAALTKRSLGVKTTRVDVMRAALQRGLASMQAELGKR